MSYYVVSVNRTVTMDLLPQVFILPEHVYSSREKAVAAVEAHAQEVVWHDELHATGRGKHQGALVEDEYFLKPVVVDAPL